jgi:hypothetical protein
VSDEEYERDLWKPPSPPERRTASRWLAEIRETLESTKPREER